MKLLIDAFDNQKTYKTHAHDSYLVLTLTDHVPSTDPAVLKAAVKALSNIAKKYSKSANKIVGEEERGGFLTVCVALETDLPFCLAKQNPSHIPGEIGVEFDMSYRKGMTMYLNGLSSDDKVLIVDDIIDSGGTLIALIKTLQKMNVEIVKVIALAERVEKRGTERIKNETGIDVETVLKINVLDEKSVVVNKDELLNQ